MTLTGKAKDDFEKWLDDGNHTPWIAFFYNLPENVMSAYYIEWLDSVGIYIGIIPNINGNGFKLMVNRMTNDMSYPNRTEALKAAITNANTIYNDKHIN